MKQKKHITKKAQGIGRTVRLRPDVAPMFDAVRDRMKWTDSETLAEMVEWFSENPSPMVAVVGMVSTAHKTQ